MSRTIYLTDAGRTGPRTVIPTGMPSRLTATRTDQFTMAAIGTATATTATATTATATTATATTATATTLCTPDRVARRIWGAAASQSTVRRTLPRMAEDRVWPRTPDRGRPSA